MVAEVLGMLGAGLASGIASSNAMDMDARYQKDLMKYQAQLNYKYAMKDLNNKWFENRKGLEKANYNPMLAYGLGANSVSSWTSPQSIDDNGIGANSVNASGQMGQLSIDQQNATTQRLSQASQSEVNDAVVRRTNAEASLTDEKIMRQQIENSNLPEFQKQQIEKLKSDIDFQKNMVNLKRQENMIAGQNAATQRMAVDIQRNQSKAVIENLRKQGLLTDAQVQKINADLKWMPADKIVGYITGILGSVTGGAIGTGVLMNAINGGKRLQFEMQPSSGYQNTNIGF